MESCNSPVGPFCNDFSIQMRQRLVRQRPFSTRPVLSTFLDSAPHLDSASVSSRHQTESAAPLSSRQNWLGCPSNRPKALSSWGGCLCFKIPVSLKKFCQNMMISVLCTIVKEHILKIHMNLSLTRVPSLLMFIIKVALSKKTSYPLIAEVGLRTK